MVPPRESSCFLPLFSAALGPLAMGAVSDAYGDPQRDFVLAQRDSPCCCRMWHGLAVAIGGRDSGRATPTAGVSRKAVNVH